MKRCLTLIVLASIGFSSAQEVLLKRPPKSLDKYYPPQSRKMEFLSNMHSMSTAIHGVQVNVNKGNWDRALFWAKNLEKVYKESANMVPEWKNYFKPKSVEDLVKAVSLKNTNSVVQSLKSVGESCSKCHAENQSAVAVYYHFPRYDNIKVEDPVELQELKTAEFMKKLSESMKSLIVFLNDSDMSGAQEEGRNFVERAKAVNTMCSKCHTSKASIESLAGKEYLALLDNLDKALSNPKQNREAILRYVSEIGQYCYRCHNVHLIPSKIQRGLDAMQKQ